MINSANTHIIVSTTGSDHPSPVSRTGSFELHEGTRLVLLDTVATDLFNFWKKLVDELYPVTSPVLVAGNIAPSANS